MRRKQISIGVELPRARQNVCEKKRFCGYKRQIWLSHTTYLMLYPILRSWQSRRSRRSRHKQKKTMDLFDLKILIAKMRAI